MLPAKLPLEHRCASDAKVREDGWQEEKPRYREDLDHRRMSMEHELLVWRSYLADETNVKTISRLEEQDVLFRQSSPTTSKPVSNVEVFAGRSPQSPVMHYDKESWTMGDLVKVDEGSN